MAKSKDGIVERALASAADRAQARADRKALEEQVLRTLKTTANRFRQITGEVCGFMEQSRKPWHHPVKSRRDHSDYRVADTTYPYPTKDWGHFEDWAHFHVSSKRIAPPILDQRIRVYLNEVVHKYTASVVERDIVVTIRITYNIAEEPIDLSHPEGRYFFSIRDFKRDFTRTYNAASLPQELHTKEQMVRLVANMVSDAQRDLLFALDNNTTRPSGYRRTCSLLTKTGWKSGTRKWTASEQRNAMLKQQNAVPTPPVVSTPPSPMGTLDRDLVIGVMMILGMVALVVWGFSSCFGLM